MSETNMVKKMIEGINEPKIRKAIGDEIFKISLIAGSEEFKELLKKYIEYPESIKILEENWKTIYSNMQNSTDLIEVCGKNEHIREEMLSNMNFLIEYGKYGFLGNTAELSKEISKLEGGDLAISENFEELLSRCIYSADDIVIPALNTEIGRQKVKQHFERIKETFFPIDREQDFEGFSRIIDNIKGLEEFKDEYEDYNFWKNLYYQIEIPEPSCSINLESSNSETISAGDLLKVLETDRIKEQKINVFYNLLFSEDRAEKRLILESVAKGNEYRYKNYGSSSLLIQAGTQVVKLGSLRRKYDIPYHYRLMLPYFRKKYKDDSCLEVYNYGNCKSANITDEALLEIYKELEKDGLIWTDARKANILELVEDNIVPEHIKSEEFNIFGFLENENYPTNNHKVLKAGDLVICDLDMIYLEKDPNPSYGNMDEIIEDYLESKNKKICKEDKEY